MRAMVPLLVDFFLAESLDPVHLGLLDDRRIPIVEGLHEITVGNLRPLCSCNAISCVSFLKSRLIELPLDVRASRVLTVLEELTLPRHWLFVTRIWAIIRAVAILIPTVQFLLDCRSDVRNDGSLGERPARGVQALAVGG